jgi:hypothetical protein
MSLRISNENLDFLPTNHGEAITRGNRIQLCCLKEKLQIHTSGKRF